MTSVIAVEKRKLDNPPLTIHYLGDKVLRQPAKRITKIDNSVRKLIREMLQTMYSASGIGLAAPQVAIPKQLLVADCEPENPKSPPVVLINPRVTATSETFCVYEEGCLSIPGVYLEVVRPQAIEVEFKDEWGRPRKLKADGLLARVIQHEMDHLKGVMFVDRVEDGEGRDAALKEKGFSPSAVESLPVMGRLE